MRNLFLILLLGLLSACSSMQYLEIETYNPAEVTFPEEVSKVLVVNNAVPQPEDTGYEYLLCGERQDTCVAKADSALFDACRVLGESMADAGFFYDVLLYHDAIRTDRDFLVGVRLTPERVKALCEETGADAVISIDRLLFDMKREVSATGDGFLLGEIDVQVSGLMRGYLPDRESPLAVVHVNDSLAWAEGSLTLPFLDHLLPAPEEVLRTAGKYIGAKSYANFVPHWEKELRWFYTGMGARWKEASAYANNEKWVEAEAIWQRLYAESSGWSSQAKAASNLALCSEMQGRLKESYEWAHKSYELFRRNEKDNGKNANLLELYVQTLARRLRSDRKLNVQFGDN